MAPRKATDIALTVIAAVFLFGVLGARLLIAAGVEFPDWTGVGSEESALEGRSYTPWPDSTIGSVRSGDFQAQLEKYLADAVPLRDAVMLANAAMQRSFIEAANVPAGFDCYPTYFASSHLYCPRLDSLSQVPVSIDDALLAAGRDSLANLAQLARDYPDTRFVVCIVQGDQFAAVNPGYRYCPNATTGSDYAQALSASIDTVPGNIAVVTTPYSSEDDFYREFFRTDHHWNPRGAARAFNEMAEATDLQHVDATDLVELEDGAYSGAFARWGRYLVEETAFDLKGVGEGLTVVGADGSREPYSHSRWLDDDTPARRFRFHDTYYDFVPDGSVVENPSGAGSALLVCDSYGADLVPMFGDSYKTLTLSRDLHGSAQTDESSSLRSFLEHGRYDCVYLVADCANYSGLALRSPNYFL